MYVTTKDISQFQELYKERFGIFLTESDAQRKLTDLVQQMAVIYQPVTEGQYISMQDENEYGEANGCWTSEANK